MHDVGRTGRVGRSGAHVLASVSRRRPRKGAVAAHHAIDPRRPRAGACVAELLKVGSTVKKKDGGGGVRPSTYSSGRTGSTPSGGGGAGEAAQIVHLQLADHVGGGGVAAGHAQKATKIVGALPSSLEGRYKAADRPGRADESLEALGDRAYVERVRRTAAARRRRRPRRRRRLRIVILGAAALCPHIGGTPSFYVGAAILFHEVEPSDEKQRGPSVVQTPRASRARFFGAAPRPFPALAV